MTLKEKLMHMELTLSYVTSVEDHVEVTVKADYNDADYLTKTTVLKKEQIEQIPELLRLASIILAYKQNNCKDEDNDFLTEEEWEIIDAFLPSTDYEDYLHTIVEFKFVLHTREGLSYDIHY